MSEHDAPKGGRGRLDLTYQLITQDEPRIDSRRAAVGEDSTGEHDEVKTINRVYTAHLDYDVDARWGLGLTLPVVSRTHDHVDLDAGKNDHWGFSGLGDLAAQVRYAVVNGAPEGAGTLTLSATGKFPTGRADARGDGGLAEVTIQPGSGSYDFIGGAVYARSAGRAPTLKGETATLPVFLATSLRVNGEGSRDYKMGNEVQVNLGAAYPLLRSVELLGQANFRTRAKDTAGRTGEEVAFTGSTFLYLSPGLRYHLTESLSLYGYAQLPVYQRVNQEQLTAPWNLLLGVTIGFGGRPSEI